MLAASASAGNAADHLEKMFPCEPAGALAARNEVVRERISKATATRCAARRFVQSSTKTPKTSPIADLSPSSEAGALGRIGRTATPQLVFLDLDNTLIPTAWIMEKWHEDPVVGTAAELSTILEEAGLFTALEGLFERALRASSVAPRRIVIVTNAAARTVDEFYLQECLPRLGHVLRKYNVKICSTERWHGTAGPVPPTEDDNAYREYYTQVKYFEFQHQLEIFAKEVATPGDLVDLVSVGDQLCEITAAIRLARARPDQVRRAKLVMVLDPCWDRFASLRLEDFVQNVRQLGVYMAALLVDSAALTLDPDPEAAAGRPSNDLLNALSDDLQPRRIATPTATAQYSAAAAAVWLGLSPQFMYCIGEGSHFFPVAAPCPFVVVSPELSAARQRAVEARRREVLKRKRWLAAASTLSPSEEDLRTAFSVPLTALLATVLRDERRTAAASKSGTEPAPRYLSRSGRSSSSSSSGCSARSSSCSSSGAGMGSDCAGSPDEVLPQGAVVRAVLAGTCAEGHSAKPASLMPAVAAPVRRRKARAVRAAALPLTGSVRDGGGGGLSSCGSRRIGSRSGKPPSPRVGSRM